ncbi:hypothetical protein CYMTET_34151, partial [Cymbomonas tetramitiformis]
MPIENASRVVNKDVTPYTLKLFHLNPLHDARLVDVKPEYQDFAKQLLAIEEDAKWHSCIEVARGSDMQWLLRLLEFASAQIQSAVVPCQFSGADIIWQLAQLPAGQRPAFTVEEVEGLLMPELQSASPELVGPQESEARQERMRATALELLEQVGAVEGSLASLWWIYRCVELEEGARTQGATQQAVIRMLEWGTTAWRGTSALGISRGRLSRQVALEQMCVGALGAILLKNEPTSEALDPLWKPIPNLHTLATDQVLGWRLLGNLIGHLAVYELLEEVYAEEECWDRHVFQSTHPHVGSTEQNLAMPTLPTPM